MIPREELAAIKELHDIAEAINHDCDTRGCAQCEDDNCRAVRYIPRLLAEVERLRGVAEAAKDYRLACIQLAAWGSDTARELVNEAKRKMIAALDAAEGGE